MDDRFIHISSVATRAEGQDALDYLSSLDIIAELVRLQDLPRDERDDLSPGWGSLRVAPHDTTSALEALGRWRQREPEADQRDSQRQRERQRDTVRRSRKESRDEREYHEERDIPDRRRRRQKRSPSHGPNG